MARPRTIPDAHIYAAIRHLLATGGDKAVGFASVARATGLAAPSLVQRYRNREGMLHAALLDAWEGLIAATRAAMQTADASPKGAQAILKTLGADPGDSADVALLAVDFRDARLRAKAAEWRGLVEGALAPRLGGGAKGREAAAILFAAWQGQLLWQAAGGKAFRMKDILARLD